HLLFGLGAFLSELTAILIKTLRQRGDLCGARFQLRLPRLVLLVARGMLLSLGMKLALVLLDLAGGAVDRLLQAGKTIASLLVAVVELAADVGQLLPGGGEILLVTIRLATARFHRLLLPDRFFHALGQGPFALLQVLLGLLYGAAGGDGFGGLH